MGWDIGGIYNWRSRNIPFLSFWSLVFLFLPLPFFTRKIPSLGPEAAAYGTGKETQATLPFLSPSELSLTLFRNDISSIALLLTALVFTWDLCLIVLFDRKFCFVLRSLQSHFCLIPQLLNKSLWLGRVSVLFAWWSFSMRACFDAFLRLQRHIPVGCN